MSKLSFHSENGRRIATGALSAGVMMAVLLAAAGGAGAYTARVKSACRGDYYRFCPKMHEDSQQLKSCMRAAGGNISVGCRNALADGGYIDRKYHSSRLGH